MHFGNDGIVRVEPFELGVMCLNQEAQVSNNDVITHRSKDVIHDIQ